MKCEIQGCNLDAQTKGEKEKGNVIYLCNAHTQKVALWDKRWTLERLAIR